MANLLDAIRNNSLPQGQGVTDETSRLQQLLRAKSGKNVAGSDIASSNLGEQQTVAQTNQQLNNQVTPGIQLQQEGQAQQAAAEQTQTGIQNQSIEQSRQLNSLQNKLKTTSLLNEMERNRGQVDLARNKAAVQQLASNLRFENTKYVDDLQREGQKNRIDSKEGFEEALANAVFGDSRELLEKQLNGKSLLNADQRDFNVAVSRMDLNAAYAMFHKDLKTQKDRALYTGIGDLVGAGTSIAGNMSKPSATSAPATTTTPATGVK